MSIQDVSDVKALEMVIKWDNRQIRQYLRSTRKQNFLKVFPHVFLQMFPHE